MIATIESQPNTSPGQFSTSHPIFLDPERKSLRVEEFEGRLLELIVGQERAVRAMTSWYQIFLAGMNQPDRPLGALLFLGPTGSGKTRTAQKRQRKYCWASETSSSRLIARSFSTATKSQSWSGLLQDIWATARLIPCCRRKTWIAITLKIPNFLSFSLTKSRKLLMRCGNSCWEF